MIINSSRATSAFTCWRKTFNRYHRQVGGARALALVDGGALHKGVAAGLATKDWNRAREAALEQFNIDVEAAELIPEEEPLRDAHLNLVLEMLKVFSQYFLDEDYQIIQPEAEFKVELPNSYHNCIWMHHLEEGKDGSLKEIRDAPPNPAAILEHRILSPHPVPDETCACWTPHQLAGRADALMWWKNNLWLHELKTTAMKGGTFWDPFQFLRQPTIYLYGVWKALKVRPSGFIVSAIYKPTLSQVEAWNKKRKYGPPKDQIDYLGYEREAFLRSEEDLKAVEEEIIELCDEWEARVLRGKFCKEPLGMHCLAYNRRCDYYDLCCSHDDPTELEALTPQPQDYIDIYTEDVRNKGLDD